MATQQAKELANRQQLEWEHYRLEAGLTEAQAALAQCKYNLRQAKAAALEYESFGIRSMLDKLTGKWEEKHETLLQEVRRSEAALAAAEGEAVALTGRKEALARELAPMAEQEDYLSCAQALNPEEKEAFLQREARICAEKLLPLLQTTADTLEAAAQWARPNNRVEPGPGYNKGKLLAQADAAADRCAVLLHRIEECGIALGIHPYFEDPVNYICAVTQFTQLDRIQLAIRAVENTRYLMQELLCQLPEEIQWQDA